ncbi:unnamed protein product [Meloidogyne enterolobii]|uniref:Uncharacterized protein n=1 Tax=Meloidogyne enterolobii TaxID=390850 RepID=A0ACB0Z3C2_MELEN
MLNAIFVNYWQFTFISNIIVVCFHWLLTKVTPLLNTFKPTIFYKIKFILSSTFSQEKFFYSKIKMEIFNLFFHNFIIFSFF